jgi:hypothetical protein
VTRNQFAARRAVLLGGLVVGGLDALDAIVFFGLRSGVKPIRIFQSISAGLLGRSAFQGGWRTAVLGACLHWFIALTIAGVYYLASRRLPILVSHPLIFGPLYGIAAYAVMNLIVLPLSAAGRPTYSWPVTANGLLIHMFGVGLPSAFAARLAHRR